MPNLPSPKPAVSNRLRYGAAGLALLLAGAAGGAGAMSLVRPTAQMAPGSPTPINQLTSGTGIVTVRGRVTDRFGNHVLLQDATGHVLVDTGPDAPAAGADPITVQGRFDRGELHARFLVDASDHVIEVGPPPHRGPPPPLPAAPPPVAPVAPAPGDQAASPG